MPPEGPDELITLRRAALLGGLAKGTLHTQARAGKLRTVGPPACALPPGVGSMSTWCKPT
jgi:hypothetical protein